MLFMFLRRLAARRCYQVLLAEEPKASAGVEICISDARSCARAFFGAFLEHVFVRYRCLVPRPEKWG